MTTGAVRRVDDFQRSHSWMGFPLAVLYKFFDDQGGYLAALITYYGFLSLFPLLLLLVTALGYLLQGDPGLQHQILHSALSQFPIVGDQIGGDVRAAHGSALAVAVGVLGSLYGGIGVVQATQNAMNVIWAVPRNTRPNPIKARLRSLLMLVVLGVGLLLTTGLSGLTTGAHAYANGPLAGAGIRGVSLVLAVLVNVLLFVAAFRLLTVRDVTSRQVLPGAVAAAIGWQVLQTIGTYLVGSKLRGASSSYGVFGVVLGLLAFIYLAAVLVVFCAEANTVAARRLWPRSLLTPFTDDVQLTEPDRRAYSSYAKAQRNKGFQQIRSRFRRRRRRADQEAPPDDP
ncbi:YihY/virulence factor BrkB family protein [Flexivirga sp.]|uniref:YihY/virulence factor BrkB family protein n=1 Tax=Flexivirga sp. TaxID=1962927 RepID=UPI003F810BDA